MGSRERALIHGSPNGETHLNAHCYCYAPRRRNAGDRLRRWGVTVINGYDQVLLP